MCDLERSDVPDEILNFEQGKRGFDAEDTPTKLLRLLVIRPLCRITERYYFEAFTAMIHLEEAAQSAFISQFNTKNIRLKYANNKQEFCIRNNVSLHHMTKYMQCT